MGTDGSTQTQLCLDDDHTSAFLGCCSTQLLGRWGEDRAAEWLVRRGFVIVDRNWRFHGGELDIVATLTSGVLKSSSLETGDTRAVYAEVGHDLPTVCVVVEVKTRRTQFFGGGVEAITRKKQQALRRGMSQWLTAHPWVNPQFIRIDLIDIAVHPPNDGMSRRCLLEHFEEVA